MSLSFKDEDYNNYSEKQLIAILNEKVFDNEIIHLFRVLKVKLEGKTEFKIPHNF